MSKHIFLSQDGESVGVEVEVDAETVWFSIHSERGLELLDEMKEEK